MKNLHMLRAFLVILTLFGLLTACAPEKEPVEAPVPTIHGIAPTSRSVVFVRQDPSPRCPRWRPRLRGPSELDSGRCASAS